MLMEKGYFGSTSCISRIMLNLNAPSSLSKKVPLLMANAFTFSKLLCVLKISTVVSRHSLKEGINFTMPGRRHNPPTLPLHLQ